MKNVLLLIHEDDGQEARFQAALDITRALGGHLTCLDVEPTPAFYFDALSGSAENLLLETGRERIAANRSAIERRLAREDVPWDWRHARGDVANALKLAAELSDIVVLSSYLARYSDVDERRVAAEVVVESGRPILAVPIHSRGIALNGSAMVAWNGSYQAVEGLRAAVPLLRLAGEVTLLEIGDWGNRHSAEEAAAYLSREDIHVQVLNHELTGAVADSLLSEANRLSASYMVMGAFGLGRTIEGLFGGVTRSILERTELPVFMAH